MKITCDKCELLQDTTHALWTQWIVTDTTSTKNNYTTNTAVDPGTISRGKGRRMEAKIPWIECIRVRKGMQIHLPSECTVFSPQGIWLGPEGNAPAGITRERSPGSLVVLTNLLALQWSINPFSNGIWCTFKQATSDTGLINLTITRKPLRQNAVPPFQ